MGHVVDELAEFGRRLRGSPVGGEVVEVNGELEADPALVNREPFSAGWLFKVKLADVTQNQNLLSPEKYEELVTSA